MKSKVKNLLLSLAVVFCAVFTSLGVAFAMQDTPINAVAETHVNLQHADVDEFETPEIGELPDMNVQPVHFCYTVTEVIWMYKTGNYFSEWNVKKPFEQGTTYRVGIVLTADDGYYYDSGLQLNAAINGEAVEYRVVDEKVVVLTKDFKLDSYITTVNVSGLKTPVAGQLPDTEVDCAHTSYTARVEWYNRTTHTVHNNDEPFVPNTSYTAEVYITAKDGYVFDVTADSVQCFVNGSSRPLTPSDKKENHTVVYYEVGYDAVQDVKVKLDKPMPGATPDFDAECSGDAVIADYNQAGYVNGVRWIDYAGGIILTEEDTFLADRTYLVDVMLEADENHQFTADRKYVYVNDRMCIEQAGRTSRTCGFKTEFRSPKEIAQVNFTDLLKPEEGNTPDYWLDIDVDGVTIQEIYWEVYNDDGLALMGENEKFVDGKTYLMSVYVKNTTDNVFATKTKADGERDVATIVTLDGEKVYPYAWKNEDGDKDPYNYMWFYCWYDCESEQVTNVATRIETPIAGAKPSYNASIVGDEMTVYSVSWTMYTTDDSGDTYLANIPSTHTFEKGETYCAFITLKVNGNRKVPYSPETNISGLRGTVNGKRADVYSVKKLDDGTEVDPYKYAKIACWFDCNGEIIDRIDISGIVAPVAGERPCYDRDINGTGYVAIGEYSPTTDLIGGILVDIYAQKNGVIWYDVTNGAYDYVYENKEFIGGHTYKLQISLEVEEGCQFAVDGEGKSTVLGFINGIEAVVGQGSMSNEAFYLRLSYEFTCEKMAIDFIDVEIDEPVIGEKPNWSKIDSKYFCSNSQLDNEDTGMTNGIAWGIYGEDNVLRADGNATFEENTEYILLVYITLKEGYIIEDADTFEVYLNGLIIFGPMVFSTEPATILLHYIFPKTDCTCSIKPVAEEPATCTTDGMKAHYACEKCGVTYKDANGEELLDLGEEEYMLWATGHKFSNWTKHEEYDNIHVGDCENCDETIEVECEFVAVYVEGPSKYSKYNGTLFVCELCGNEGAFYVDETSCEHVLGEWQENDRMSGRHYRTCECGKIYEEEDCNYAITIERYPSEYSDIRDVYLYTCKDCGGEHYEPIEGEAMTEESITDEETNVTVSIPANSQTVLPEGTTVSAQPVNTGNISDEAKEMMEKSLNGTVDVVSGYDIVLYYKDVEIQPYASVEVTIPIGEDVEKSDDMTIVYYDDYSITGMETVVFNWEEGTVTFETDHFSKYLIIKYTPNPEHEHNHGSNWETDENEHWNECECGDKANVGTHADSDNNGKCDTCDYQMANGGGNTETPDKQKDGLGAGAIVGIIGGVVVLCGIVVVLFIIKKKKLG